MSTSRMESPVTHGILRSGQKTPSPASPMLSTPKGTPSLAERRAANLKLNCKPNAPTEKQVLFKPTEASHRPPHEECITMPQSPRTPRTPSQHLREIVRKLTSQSSMQDMLKIQTKHSTPICLCGILLLIVLTVIVSVLSTLYANSNKNTSPGVIEKPQSMCFRCADINHITDYIEQDGDTCCVVLPQLVKSLQKPPVFHAATLYLGDEPKNHINNEQLQTITSWSDNVHVSFTSGGLTLNKESGMIEIHQDGHYFISSVLAFKGSNDMTYRTEIVQLRRESETVLSKDVQTRHCKALEYQSIPCFRSEQNVPAKLKRGDKIFIKSLHLNLLKYDEQMCHFSIYWIGH